jgi:iron complex outermembrane receptor protein
LYSGTALQLAGRFDLGGGTSGSVLAGLEYDRMTDDRQGYINNAGQRGMLRRDEDDLVYNTDALMQATFDFGSKWSAVAGVRASRVRFETHDRYIAPGNPDDSGTLDYRSTNPVGGVTWRAPPDWNLYVNAGRGFETPTFTELAYRNDASGLNTDLKASRSDHFEAGTKWRPVRELRSRPRCSTSARRTRSSWTPTWAGAPHSAMRAGRRAAASRRCTRPPGRRAC